ncbi:uncharacterized protein H6S33_012176 [Morchella sextelata]|uniref:uncharacterized protein n=1 Tax=Morchella sextelata TaxID=1174677 RepID=UPI001D04FDC2|nr:uncharacterized protein H6S33_012176 [Morchella sextelata]KAH0610649.1 hypothetical protein H6S33_012176 [Morchella sextelata]
MTSPDDLNPPSYLRGSPPSNLSDPFTPSSSSPPPRRKSRFTTTTTTTSTSAPYLPTRKPHRDPFFTGTEVSSPPASLMLPPPAVTTYAYARSYSAYSNQRSPLHSLRQQAKHLTEQLQVLLDAQSTALMSGGTFAPAPPKPPQRSGRKGQGQGQGPPPMSLGEARHGITRSMKELADIKDVESDIYASQVSDRQSLIKTVNAWGTKTKLLEAEIHSIEDGDEGRRMEALRTEKGELEAEIQRIRVHLAKMEDKLAAVSIQLSEGESVVGAKTSSYKAALASLKSKTSGLLASHRYATPATAVESWTRECEALTEKRSQAGAEGGALRDGIVLWEDTLQLVGGFEESLRAHMATAAGAGKRVNTADVKARILQDIEETIGKLEEILALAEDKNWKLLCCCVGAELQVFLEGREVMKKSMEGDRSAIPSTKSTLSSTEASKDSSDGGGSQHDERSSSATMTQSRSSLRGGLGGFGLGGGVRKLGSLRKSLSPAPPAVRLSLLDRRSDDGQSPHENDGDDERDESVDLLLKVDSVGDGVQDGRDYSPLDD